MGRLYIGFGGAACRFYGMRHFPYKLKMAAGLKRAAVYTGGSEWEWILKTAKQRIT